MSKKKKARPLVVLLDTHAIIHRSYHAMPDLTSPAGEPTGALYGLANMLFRITNDFDPDYIVAAYDLPGPTIRHHAYEGYKATRVKGDDALYRQIETAKELLAAFGVPVYARPGFEADDVIATATEALRNEEVDVLIASGDMDTLQLVEDPRVKVFTLRRGLTDTIVYDEKGVLARYGFPPSAIPDYKGLAGDSSDNIKGVPGVGEKTATALIQAFGSIDGIYAALARGDEEFLAKGMKPRIIGLLRTHEENARFSKELATVRRDAPVSFALPKESWPACANGAALIGLVDQLGFRTLRNKAIALVGGEDGGVPEIFQEHADSTIFREAQVMAWLLDSDLTNATPEEVLRAAGSDSISGAHAALSEKIAADPALSALYEQIEKPLIPVLLRMQDRGVALDVRLIASLAQKYRTELARIEQDIWKLGGKEFNVASPRDLAVVLYDDLALGASSGARTATGHRSTKESELEKIIDDHPIVAKVLEYRELSKLIGTYLEALPRMTGKDGRLRAQFLQTGTVTGRMSSKEPNLQNIPIKTERGRVIRDAFIAEEGKVLIALDYSQIELRIAALLSGDTALIEVFAQGGDIHRATAARMFGKQADEVSAEERRQAKAINFGILYGMGANALKRQLGVSLGEAQAFLAKYFETYPALKEYLERVKGDARKKGYTETLFGRRRRFEGLESPLPMLRAQAERMAMNAPIQGTQADLIKKAMVAADQALAEGGYADAARLILQVHDELVYEVTKDAAPAVAAIVRREMEGALPEALHAALPIVAEARIGTRWGSLTNL